MAGLVRADRVRWAAVGRSAHPDPAVAGRDAATAALAGRGDAGLLLLFASGDLDLETIAAAVDDVAGPVPVVGASSAGEVAADGPSDGSVVAMALGGPGLRFSTAAVRGGAPREAGARAAACLGDVADCEHRVLLLLADGAPATHAEIVRGAYSVTGAGVPLVGGVAGNPAHIDGRNAVLAGGEVLDDAVVAVAIGSDAPLGIGARHGWEPEGAPMLVTRAAPGRVLELDERPAAEVYRERLPVEPTDDAVLARPLGLERRGGEPAIRSVFLDGADDDGGIQCALPAGALAWMMSTTAENVLASADVAAREAVGALQGATPRALLVFGCTARAKVLGRAGARDEIARVMRHADGAAVAGLYTWGEFARTRGIVGAHHQTLVVLAIA